MKLMGNDERGENRNHLVPYREQDDRSGVPITDVALFWSVFYGKSPPCRVMVRVGTHRSGTSSHEHPLALRVGVLAYVRVRWATNSTPIYVAPSPVFTWPTSIISSCFVISSVREKMEPWLLEELHRSLYLNIDLLEQRREARNSTLVTPASTAAVGRGNRSTAAEARTQPNKRTFGDPNLRNEPDRHAAPPAKKQCRSERDKLNRPLPAKINVRPTALVVDETAISESNRKKVPTVQVESKKSPDAVR